VTSRTSNVLGTITDRGRSCAHVSAVRSTPASRRRTCRWTCALDTDFWFPGLRCSAVGVLRPRQLLAAMPPFMTGRDVTRDVGFDRWSGGRAAEVQPARRLRQAIGLAAAVGTSGRSACQPCVNLAASPHTPAAAALPARLWPGADLRGGW
jgi:hypothetical protein